MEKCCESELLQPHSTNNVAAQPQIGLGIISSHPLSQNQQNILVPQHSPDSDILLPPSSSQDFKHSISPSSRGVKRTVDGSPKKKLKTLAPRSLFVKKIEYCRLPKIKKRKTHHSDGKQSVRPILPKNYSPTKSTALMLKRKATLVCQRKSPVKILPKHNTESVPPPAFSRVFTRSQGFKSIGTENSTLMTLPAKPTIDVQPAQAEVDHEYISEADFSETNDIDDAATSQEEDLDDVERDEDQVQLDDLMAACTTIRYDPNKCANSQENDTKSKTQRRKEVCLSMLEEDILERDPKKDERDTEYANDFFNRVKHTFKDDPETFRQFLVMLHDMSKDKRDPVQLYSQMAIILQDHQDLLDDFAGFLLSHQAVECGCFMQYFQYQQVRGFLRKLEIYCENTTTPFHRMLRMLSKWMKPGRTFNPDEPSFKERAMAVLKSVPGLLEESLDLLLDDKISESQSDEFEVVTIGDSHRVSGFEELKFPKLEKTYNNSLCGCKCHVEEREDTRYKYKSRHCLYCSFRLGDDGEPVLKISRHEFTPLTLIYPHKEREKLKKAKREAAQLALAKAKARRSGIKTRRARTSQGGKPKRLVFRRRSRKKISKAGQIEVRSLVSSCSEPSSTKSRASVSKGSSINKTATSNEESITRTEISNEDAQTKICIPKDVFTMCSHKETEQSPAYIDKNELSTESNTDSTQSCYKQDLSKTEVLSSNEDSIKEGDSVNLLAEHNFSKTESRVLSHTSDTSSNEAASSCFENISCETKTIHLSKRSETSDGDASSLTQFSEEFDL